MFCCREVFQHLRQIDRERYLNHLVCARRMRQPPGMIQPKEQVLLKWQSLCSEQEQSGQSAAAFCRARELRPSQFYYWKKRVREAAMPQFVEVRVSKPATPTDSRVGCHSTYFFSPNLLLVAMRNEATLSWVPKKAASALRLLVQDYQIVAERLPMLIICALGRCAAN